MNDAGAQAGAHNPSVRVTGKEDVKRVAQKVYAVMALEAKVTKLRAHLAAAEASLAEAIAERDAR
jgi:hypothetical protein